MPQVARKLNGPTVRVIRELTGIRASTFAKRIEIDPGYLTKIEQGARQPSVEVMRRIADGLGVGFEIITYPSTSLSWPNSAGEGAPATAVATKADPGLPHHSAR